MAASPEGRVRLGPALARLATTARADMARIAHPYLEELSRRINETVEFAVLDGDDAVFIDQVVAPNQLRAEFSLGDAFPMHCSAHGKAILAALDIPRAVALAEAELPEEPGRVTRLMEELDEVRRTGLAFDREEHIKGICAVSAAVRDSLGGVGAISVPVPATRFYDNEDTLTAELLEFLPAHRNRAGFGGGLAARSMIPVLVKPPRGGNQCPDTQPDGADGERAFVSLPERCGQKASDHNR